MRDGNVGQGSGFELRRRLEPLEAQREPVPIGAGLFSDPRVVWRPQADETHAEQEQRRAGVWRRDRVQPYRSVIAHRIVAFGDELARIVDTLGESDRPARAGGVEAALEIRDRATAGQEGMGGGLPPCR